MKGIDKEYKFATRAIHAGQEPDPSTGAVMTPIYATSTYAQSSPGVHKGYEYARTQNPTRMAFERCLADLEGGRQGWAFASGLAASATLLDALPAGSHIVALDDLYGGTYRLFERVRRTSANLTVTFTDMRERAQLEAAIRPDTRMIWVESPSNPLLKIADIRRCAEIAHATEATCVVDNTFATPYLQRPLELGADVVVHSVTKYLAGHSDLVSGALVVQDGDTAERLAFLQNAVGAVPGPVDCYLALRGVKTLALRMEQHCRGAQHVAEFLAGHDRVAKVHYPGLPDHPGHDVAARQMSGFGGMASFEVGSEEEAIRVAERTKLFFLAESLGGVESLIEVPGPMTHASVAGSALEVPPTLIRLSVGIEHPDDLIADLEQALS